jgi:hypothetical protein
MASISTRPRSSSPGRTLARRASQIGSPSRCRTSPRQTRVRTTARRQRPHHGREDRRRLRGARRRRRTDLLRVQPLHLSAGGDDRTPDGRDRHAHAGGHDASAGRRGRVRERRTPRRLDARGAEVLSADAVTGGAETTWAAARTESPRRASIRRRVHLSCRLSPVQIVNGRQRKKEAVLLRDTVLVLDPQVVEAYKVD